MVHMATLVHDDVVDHASARRGRPTAAALWGNTAAILSGDVLLSKAMEILAEDGDIRIIRSVSRAVVEMAEGEVLELETRGDFDLSRETHLAILDKKTACFMRCCCEAGAMLAGAEDEATRMIGDYGHALGMGFQIADDLLDFRGKQETTGKPRATDFREGCATLPLIYLRDRLNMEEDAFVRQAFGNQPSDETVVRVAELMEVRGAFLPAADDAATFGQKAEGAISGLPPSAAKELLLALPELVVRRES
jgi:octaprenyl-diphosphate synthase